MAQNLATEQLLSNLGQRVGADGTSINDALAERIGFQMQHEQNEDYKDAEVDQDLIDEVDELEEDDALSPEMVVVGDQQIAQYHPLVKTRIEKTWPILCCCFRCCRAEQEETEEQAKINEGKIVEIEMRKARLKAIIKQNGGRYKGTGFVFDAKDAQGLNSKDDVEEVAMEEGEEDLPPINRNVHPLKKLGLGISVWIEMLENLCVLFFFISIIAFGMCQLMKAQGGKGTNLTDPDDGFMNRIADYSLGNFQGAQSTCFNQMYSLDAKLTQKIKCQRGKIAPLLYYGYIAAPEEGESSIRKLEQVEMDESATWSEEERKFGFNYCGDMKRLSEYDSCAPVFKKGDYKKAFDDACSNKTECNFQLKQVTNDIIPSSKSALKGNDVKYERCVHKNAQIYIQVQCILDGKELEDNQVVACVMLMCTMVICSVFFEVMQYRSSMSALSSKQYDMATCTAADYSIRVNITSAWFNAFKEHNQTLIDSGKKKKCMMRELIKDFETDLVSRRQAITRSRSEAAIADEEAADNGLPSTTEIKVASVRFAYKNRSVIQLLQKRGKLIGTAADFEEVEKCDAQLNSLTADNAEQLQTPVCAFITFTTQEAKERAMKYYCKFNEDGTDNGDYDPITSNEEVLEVLDAPEPSNILWENLQISKLMVRVNQGAVYVAIIIILAIVFGTMSLLKLEAANNLKMYPPRMPCDGIQSLYENSEKYDTVWKNPDFKIAAESDKKPTMQLNGGGYYQCFCKSYKYSQLGQIWEKGEDHLCYDYFFDKAKITSLNLIITILISVINIVLRLIVEMLVNRIGYDTDSERVSTIMVITFVSMFLNTGVITLLVNAEFTHMDPPFSWLPFHADFPDFNRDWYTTLGTQMVKTMLIAAVAPLVELIIGYFTRTAKAILDSGFPCCPRMHEYEDYGEEDDIAPVARKTKKTTVYQYVELYVGPVYLPHSKYAQIMLIVWIAFMFGSFIPAMWIVSFFAVFIFVTLETFMLTYVYRKPPMFDAALDVKANALLRYAPILTFAVGYWAHGNMQMFHNLPPKLNFINRAASPGHQLLYLSSGIDQSHLALCCFIMWSCRIFIDILCRLRKLCSCRTEDEEAELADAEENEQVFDENLPNYWAAIPGHQQMQMYAQELYDRRVCGVKSLNKDSMKMIATTRRDRTSQKYLSGAINYDMLNTRKYNHDLQYDLLLDREIDHGDEGEQMDDNGNTILPEKLEEQNNWQMRDQIRVALHYNENLDLPKKYERRGGRLMNTGKNMIEQAKRRKQLEKMLLAKKKTRRGTVA